MRIPRIDKFWSAVCGCLCSHHTKKREKGIHLLIASFYAVGQHCGKDFLTGISRQLTEKLVNEYLVKPVSDEYIMTSGNSSEDMLT